MSCGFSIEFIEERIAELKIQLTENTVAIAAARNQVSYSLDSGQTRQSVTRQSVGQLRNERRAIIEELAFWQNMLCGGSTTRVVPSW